jgi:TetR/AcrR family transcriptional regulator, cholesterol catabolism regulator
VVTGATTGQGRRGGSPAQSERRRRMLDATIELACEGGFDAVQMREVAERADVAVGTLYRYFPSKIHLLVLALDRELGVIEGRTATQVFDGDTARERVMDLLGRMTRGLQGQPKLAEALVRAFMFADATASDEIDLVGSRLTTMISGAIAGDPRHRGPTREDAATISVIVDVWLAALVRWVTGRTRATEVEQSVDVAVRLLLP